MLFLMNIQKKCDYWENKKNKDISMSYDWWYNERMKKCEYFYILISDDNNKIYV